MRKITIRTVVASLTGALAAGCLAQDTLDRTVLPIPEPQPKVIPAWSA